jgi:hypothetical protein
MQTKLFKNRKLFSIIAMIFALPVLLVLSANTEVARKSGNIQSFPVEDNVHIYKGAHVNINASGYVQPATDATALKYAGIAYEECDNTLVGHAQGGKDVRVEIEGRFLLVATGMAQTSVGQFCYVSSDASVALTSTYSIPVGKVVEYVASTSVWVEVKKEVAFLTNPTNRFAAIVTKTADYVVLVGDSGTTFGIATDGKKFTLPATVAGLQYTFVNTGADGNNIITIDPAAADNIVGGGIAAGIDDKDYINTKATAKKYDFVTIVGNGGSGYIVTEKQGVWAAE